MLKLCTGCNTEKEQDMFYLDRTKADGKHTRCIECFKDCQRQYRSTHKKERNASGKAWSQTRKAKYGYYKRNAKKRDLAFDLTMEEFMTFWQAYCTYCPDQIATIGIDRIDSSKGYSLENCVPCCWECNRIKGDRNIDNINTHMLKMLKHQGVI